jgi:hypothetical protein
VIEGISVVVFNAPHVISEEVLKDHNDGDVNGNTEDLSPHNFGNNLILFFGWWVLNN